MAGKLESGSKITPSLLYSNSVNRLIRRRPPTMAVNSSEITDLFSKLAFHLQTLTLSHTPSPEDSNSNSDSVNLSISKLNRSFNLTGDDNRATVLDTALSLMCFKAPQVFDCMIEHLVKTIVSVLCSSIRCNVLRLENEEILQIGSLISMPNCVEFIEIVNDVVSKLEEQGMPSHLLASAVARVAVSASCCRYLVPSIHLMDSDSIHRKCSAISKLLVYLPKESSLENHEIPLRLLSWYLDPLPLKHDISYILQNTIERPFLSLSKEFYDRTEWQSILICLVLSPTMFIHAKAMLHSWFMLTGLGSVLVLLTELVSVILDVISRPTWWGISMELGPRLPFSNAYFPYKNDLLRTLVGPLSSLSFLQLVDRTCKPDSLLRKQFGLTCEPSSVKTTSIDPKSVWALAICFPDWFYFASVLLFSNNFFQKNFQSERIIGAPKFTQTNDKEHIPAAAARYIAWILRPNNQSQQDLLFNNLIKMSEFWTLRQFDSVKSERVTAGNKKKRKNSKNCDYEEDVFIGNEYNCQVIGLWLKEFQSLIKYGNKSVNNTNSFEANSSFMAWRNNLLLRRVPLGLLIGWPSYAKEDGFELLLHHAATGRMLHSASKNARMDHIGKVTGRLEDLVTGIYECSKKEAVAGACIVFCLTDIAERLSSVYENEKSGLVIIFQVKLWASRYLIKCLKRLIELNIDEDGDVTLMDLHDKLMRWRHQGQEMSKIDKNVDDAIMDLSLKLLPVSGVL
ncbi:uncharacterized protein LOC126666998 [Mercurialis annua]|uniref:uncharacterized protein LOC126666998 n=1 Tax=Mercurialis annua TaxID=3986 RepID=UPI00215F63AF|nr:uncharacterized protein LOC126666998 [Mercurialis annua]XP_050215896.1 uncharacterized protein LOC126666998 [Mercurialis annua]XP_055960466.1 uncharacterized protein LOC126666998 [Mercurialis annua]